MRELGERTLARVQALQLLFQAHALGEGLIDLLAEKRYTLESAPLLEYADELARGVVEHTDDIDDRITDAAENWTIARMPSVDRELLRLAVYEMVYVEDVPVSVTINEAVEIAKRYGTDESSKFVNGVLGRIADDIESEA